MNKTTTSEVSETKEVKVKLSDWDKDPAKHTKEILDKQEKINFIVPVAEGDQPGAYETVQINGHKYTIKKGEMVLIPRAVANLLAEKYRIGMMAGKDNRADRSSAVQDALS
jgi:hypothetical protein